MLLDARRLQPGMDCSHQLPSTRSQVRADGVETTMPFGPAGSEAPTGRAHLTGDPTDMRGLISLPCRLAQLAKVGRHNSTSAT